MKIRFSFAAAAALAAFVFPSPSPAADKGELLRPFVLASTTEGDMEKLRDDTLAKLTAAGFEVVGHYGPYDGAVVIGVTSSELKESASRSEFGGYGAVQRVSLTEVEGKVQVAWRNPTYMAHVYRMEGDLSGVAEKLESALGMVEEFGSRKGLKVKKLRKYHYMAMMPYFDDHDELSAFEGHEAAVKAVETGLEASPGTSKVYRVDIPGKEESLFGAAVLSGKGADGTVMPVIDGGELRHTAHLPYEILVSRGRVYALHGKFRIALNFPDLGMVTFMKISGAPAGIRDTLKEAVKAGNPPE